jgi:hypothetical protein
MLVPPPPKPHRKNNTLISCILIGAVVLAGGALAIHSIIASGITKGPDNLFGDQHLKTAVALIELHKVRFGKYPESLSNLKFTGQWDQIALQNVHYYPNGDRMKYYIEVERSWVAKPDLKMPEGFWQGTGYDQHLKP